MNKFDNCYWCRGEGKVVDGKLILKIGPLSVLIDKERKCPVCLGTKTALYQNEDSKSELRMH